MDRVSRLKILWAFLVVIMIIGKAFCFFGEVEDISGKKYFPVVKEAIEEAKESIFMVMYIVSLDERNKESMVYKLCDELVKAKDRGVKVKVILDQNIGFSKARVDGEWQIEGKNENAFRFFKDNGIEVYYDDMTTFTHSKTLARHTKKGKDA